MSGFAAKAYLTVPEPGAGQGRQPRRNRQHRRGVKPNGSAAPTAIGLASLVSSFLAYHPCLSFLISRRGVPRCPACFCRRFSGCRDRLPFPPVSFEGWCSWWGSERSLPSAMPQRPRPHRPALPRVAWPRFQPTRRFSSPRCDSRNSLTRSWAATPSRQSANYRL